jgi:Nidogen-like
MKRFIRVIAALASSSALSLGMVLTPLPGGAIPLLGGFGGPSGFGTSFLPGNDDNSTAILPLPFNISFYGNTYSSFYVNNNGNITFQSEFGSFTPSAFPGTTQPIIAPWWADVDTRNGGSDVVYYVAPNPNSLVVTWPNVGYFASAADKLNSFQLVLQRTPNDSSGAFTAEFRYEQLQWTTGDASEGSGGLGGIPANAGYDAGDGINYYSLPGARTAEILDVVNQSNVSPTTPGLWQFNFSEGSAPGDTPENPLMPVIIDNSFVFNFPVQPNQTFFIDPEIAIGYDYAVSGGPLFASVTAPTGINASNMFDLVFGAANVPITGGIAYIFGAPQSSFRIQGIDVAANLDPTNPLAFNTGVGFDTAGFVTVTQTPITTFNSSAVPGPIPLLGVGAAFGFSRKLRKRIKSLKLESLGVM